MVFSFIYDFFIIFVISFNCSNSHIHNLVSLDIYNANYFIVDT